MAAKERIAYKISWLESLQEDLALAEELEAKHGLVFTDEEKGMLQTLRDNLPRLEALFARLPR